MKIIVITGASSGFGALTARALAKAGHTVYAGIRDTTGRNAPQVADVKKFAHDNKVDLRPLELNVSSEKSIEAAIRQIVAEQGRLDVLMHNAGHMVFGPAEAFTPEQLAELYDINVLSTQRVNRVAVPQMRKQRQGLNLDHRSRRVPGKLILWQVLSAMKGAGKHRSRRTPAVAQNRARSSRVGGCPDQEQVSPRAIPPPEESTGPKKAILAVAACMLTAAYHILKDVKLRKSLV